jgi:hypothetical protein
MANLTLLKVEALTVFQQLLAELGFKNHGGGIFTRALNEETLGWIGFGTALRKTGGNLWIYATIGVRNQRLHKTLASIRGDRYHRYAPPTTSVHIGYLMPGKQFTYWPITEREDVAPAVQRLARAIREYGEPFMEANATLGQLTATLEHGQYDLAEQLAYRLPIAYLLLGRYGEAEDHVRSWQRRIESRTDPAAHAFRAFAEAFLEQLRNCWP